MIHATTTEALANHTSSVKISVGLNMLVAENVSGNFGQFSTDFVFFRVICLFRFVVFVPN